MQKKNEDKNCCPFGVCGPVGGGGVQESKNNKQYLKWVSALGESKGKGDQEYWE